MSGALAMNEHTERRLVIAGFFGLLLATLFLALTYCEWFQ